MDTINNSLKHFIYYLFTRGISLLNALVSNILIARYLGASGYGVIAYSVSLSTILTLLLPLGISSRVSLDLVEGKHADKTIITNSLLLRSIAAFLILLVVILVCTIFSDFLNIKYQKYVLILSILNLTNIFKIFEIYWLAKEKGNLLSTVRLVSTFIALALKVIGIITTSSLLFFVFVSSSEVVLNNVLIFIFSLRRDLISLSQISKSYCIAILKRSYPICANILFTGLVRNADILLLSWFVPVSEIGYFAISKKITSSFGFLPVETANFFYHKIGKEDNTQFKKATLLGSIIILLAIVCSLPLILCSHFLISSLYGPNFNNSTYILIIFAFFMPFSFWYAYRKKLIVIFDKEHIVLIYSIITAFTLLLISLLLGPNFGAYGIALASGISFLISVLVAPFLLRQTLELKIIKSSIIHIFLPLRLVKDKLFPGFI